MLSGDGRRGEVDKPKHPGLRAGVITGAAPGADMAWGKDSARPALGGPQERDPCTRPWATAVISP